MAPQSDTLPLHPEFMDANRAGKLADAQRAALRRFDRGPVGNHLLVAAACVVLAILLLTSHAPGRNASLRPFAAIAALVVAGWLIRRSLGIGGRLARDLAAGRVEWVDGAVAKGRNGSSGTPDDNDVFFLQVGGHRFTVYPGVYRAAPDAGIVRLYYLPASRHVVNLERLPDRTLAEGAISSPLEAFKAIAPGLRSHDRGERAEAAAALEALTHAIRPEQARSSTPPPLAERDPRPLAEAILGRWQSGAVSLSFASDGTVAVTLPDGQERRGSWSVDPAGRLQADIAGVAEVGEAWVVGDTLTVLRDGAALTFHRR